MCRFSVPHFPWASIILMVSPLSLHETIPGLQSEYLGSSTMRCVTWAGGLHSLSHSSSLKWGSLPYYIGLLWELQEIESVSIAPPKQKKINEHIYTFLIYSVISQVDVPDPGLIHSTFSNYIPNTHFCSKVHL